MNIILDWIGTRPWLVPKLSFLLRSKSASSKDVQVLVLLKRSPRIQKNKDNVAEIRLAELRMRWSLERK